MVNTPMIRAAGPDDLGAVADLLTDAFLPDPIMSVIVAAAPDPRAALDHLHRIELASHYLSEDEAVRASARVDAAVDGSGRLLGVTLWDAPGTDGEAHDVAGPLGLAGALPPGLDLGLLGGAWELCLLNNRTCEAHRPPTPHWYLYMIAVAPRPGVRAPAAPCCVTVWRGWTPMACPLTWSPPAPAHGASTSAWASNRSPCSMLRRCRRPTGP